MPLERSRSPGRKDLQPGQISRIVVLDREGGNRRVVLDSDRLIEAPNWSPDGKWLIVNCDGLLYRIDVESGAMEHIDTGDVDTCNNDHILSPDGATIYVSASGHLYAVPFEGGSPRKVSNDHPDRPGYLYYLHGVSPDGETLAYVSVEPHNGDPRGHRRIATIPAAGGADTWLTDGTQPADGPEYTPDGAWLWFNWEENGTGPGHAQIFRMRPDGSEKEQMTFGARVSWFPHFAPSGEELVFLSYAPGTISHPADVDLHICRMPVQGGEPVVLVEFFGGQGSLNVNSWAPDSTRFAYVEYPEEA